MLGSYGLKNLNKVAPQQYTQKAKFAQPQQKIAQKFQLKAAEIQFIRGNPEKSTPEIKLTRSQTGETGTATFIFKEATLFTTSEAQGDVTGMFMIDDEGEIATMDVKANFTNGKPESVVATHIIRTQNDWDRFMRFMERYAQQSGMEFQRADNPTAKNN